MTREEHMAIKGDVSLSNAKSQIEFTIKELRLGHKATLDNIRFAQRQLENALMQLKESGRSDESGRSEI